MDQLLDQARELAEGQIDFEGQRLAEVMATVLLAIAGAIAFIIGYFRQDIKLALYVGLAGTAVTFLAVVPPWGFFRKSPVKWLPAGGKESSSQGIIVDGTVVG